MMCRVPPKTVVTWLNARIWDDQLTERTECAITEVGDTESTSKDGGVLFCNQQLNEATNTGQANLKVEEAYDASSTAEDSGNFVKCPYSV